ncbi:hypothetical protein CR513_39666, partial [Mucuna pruriens]
MLESFQDVYPRTFQGDFHPSRDRTLDRFHCGSYLDEPNLHSRYYQIRMREDEKWKTTFKTKFGLYEWFIMSFGLTNVMEYVHRLMNHVLRSLIGRCVVEFHEQFPYIIKHKQGKANIVANALSRRNALLAMLEIKLLGFESLKDLYIADVDFSEAYDHCAASAN